MWWTILPPAKSPNLQTWTLLTCYKHLKTKATHQSCFGQEPAAEAQSKAPKVQSEREGVQLKDSKTKSRQGSLEHVPNLCQILADVCSICSYPMHWFLSISESFLFFITFATESTLNRYRNAQGSLGRVRTSCGCSDSAQRPRWHPLAVGINSNGASWHPCAGGIGQVTACAHDSTVQNDHEWLRMHIPPAWWF